MAEFEGVTAHWATEKLVAMAAWAKVEAENASAKAAREEAKRYREWLNSGPANGLSRQHSATKCAGNWVPAKMIKVRNDE